jgi:hypothetical protein
MSIKERALVEEAACTRIKVNIAIARASLDVALAAAVTHTVSCDSHREL